MALDDPRSVMKISQTSIREVIFNTGVLEPCVLTVVFEAFRNNSEFGYFLFGI